MAVDVLSNEAEQFLPSYEWQALDAAARRRSSCGPTAANALHYNYPAETPPSDPFLRVPINSASMPHSILWSANGLYKGCTRGWRQRDDVMNAD
jgi:hypothetical protein